MFILLKFMNSHIEIESFLKIITDIPLIKNGGINTHLFPFSPKILLKMALQEKKIFLRYKPTEAKNRIADKKYQFWESGLRYLRGNLVSAFFTLLKQGSQLCLCPKLQNGSDIGGTRYLFNVVILGWTENMFTEHQTFKSSSLGPQSWETKPAFLCRKHEFYSLQRLSESLQPGGYKG